jgi:CubicO group peptidase (beta-lactamase class C family)
MRALDQVRQWPASTAAAGVVSATEELGSIGPRDVVLSWASVTKVLTGVAALVALEEGIVELDEPAGPPGATLRHLLAHASGLPTDGPAPIAAPGQRRIYSNTGIEVVAMRVAEAARLSFDDYLRRAVLVPLGLRGGLRGSPAWGYAGPLTDLLALGRELLAPRLVARETLAEATVVQFSGLVGVLPGFGRADPNDWGLAFELRDAKSPHWTGSRNSPRTFGHFGASGTFLWIDPDAGVALACLTDLEFGDWARAAWPQLSDAVVYAAEADASTAG